MSTMNSTTSIPPAMEFLGQVAFHFYKMKPLLPMYLHLLISASFPIITAAHSSLKRPPSAAPVKNSKSKTPKDGSEDEETSLKLESLNISDAILFPILAGITLSALYFIIKWLEDPVLLNKILGYYFSWVGVFFCAQYLSNIFHFTRSWIFPTQYSSGYLLYKVDPTNHYFLGTKEDGTVIKKTSSLPGILSNIPLPKAVHSTLWKIRRTVYFDLTCIISVRKPLSPGKATIRITALDILAAILAIGIATYQNLFATNGIPWFLTNLIGTSFCYTSLQIISPGSAAIGSLLLSLLFFYDIYMVFYTPMMVTVATKLDVPIKLLFPRPHEVLPEPINALPGSQEMVDDLESLAKKRTMAMLGLGDIVVPGILIALALRFDLYRYYVKIKAKDQTQRSRPESLEDLKGEEKDKRPAYSPARGSWAERYYTARKHWSPVLEAKAFPKPYFTATMFGYVGGMITTVLVMQIFNHAQPALLYLVPGVLISMWGTALWKGELSLLWSYDEAEEDKAKEKADEEAKKKKEENNKNTDEEPDTSEESASGNEKQDASEKAVDTQIHTKPKSENNGGLCSILSIHICINEQVPDKPTALEPSVAEKSSRSSTEVEIEHLTGSSGSPSSPSPTSSTSSTPEIVTKDEIDQQSEEEDQLKKSVPVPVSTKSDQDGSQAVKRRRRG